MNVRRSRKAVCFFLPLVSAAVFLVVPSDLGRGRELSLSEVVHLALANHPDIRQAELKVTLTQLQVELGWAKAAWPTLSLGVGSAIPSLFSPQVDLTAGLSLPFWTSSRLAGKLALHPATDGLVPRSWGVSFSVTLDLADPSGAVAQLEKSAQAAEDAKRSLEKTKATVIVNLIRSYSELLSLSAKLKQARANLEKAERDLVQAESAFDAGLVGRVDVLEARISAVEARIAVEGAEGNWEAQRTRFARDDLGLEEDIELLPLTLAVDDLVAAARALLMTVDVVEAAERSSEVLAAKQKVEEAEQALDRIRRSWLPTVSMEAAWTNNGLQLGWTMGFDLFSPGRDKEIAMAEAELASAWLALRIARQSAQRQLSDLQASVQAALGSLERLPLEAERWALQEELYRTKYELGTLSESDWREFQRQKEAFVLEADQRSISLFVAYLNLRAGVGLPLEWEEWLK